MYFKNVTSYSKLNKGILGLNKARVSTVHLGEGKVKKESNQTGTLAKDEPISFVRNCMFEPTSNNIDWINSKGGFQREYFNSNQLRQNGICNEDSGENQKKFVLLLLECHQCSIEKVLPSKAK